MDTTGTTTGRPAARLLFLYGPPGVGKLTVARELAALTGLRLFHNHLTVDLVESIFPRGTSQFVSLISRFRREMMAEAAVAGAGVIFTYVYAHPNDEADVAGLIQPFRAVGGDVLFVRLTCAGATLHERVTAESRRAFGKLVDPEILRGLMERNDLLSPVPHGESLTVDTGQMTAADAACLIAEHYRLTQL